MMTFRPGFVEETIRIIVNNLEDDREHLALQLCFAQGLITKEVFEHERARYLVKSNMSLEELVDSIKVLRVFTGERTCTELVMIALRCTKEQADEALRKIK